MSAPPPATRAALDALRRGDFLGVRELRLPGLTAFPAEVFGLADTLEVLDVGGGALAGLPADMGRLKRLRVLFLSGNPLPRLPPCLGDCPALSQVGARGCGLAEVPGEALPPNLRWLTLTDNRIARLPAELGHRPRLQKLMLAGNRLDRLPATMANCESLELIRLAANRFEALPDVLTRLPRLAWIAYAGNPCEPALPPVATARVPWGDLVLDARLGEGASGRVHRVRRSGEGGGEDALALKLFKGAMTSDGLPEREMQACLRAGAHPNLTGGLGRLEGHPEGRDGLLMPLLPARWRVLAGPPSPDSCSRDVYAPDLRLSPGAALRLARGVAAGLAHLHARRLLHGDVYGHNVLWDGEPGDHGGAAVLSDFGAASILPEGAPGAALRRIETRAFGLLLGEVLGVCPELGAVAALRDLERACVRPDVGARPEMPEVAAALSGIDAPSA